MSEHGNREANLVCAVAASAIVISFTPAAPFVSIGLVIIFVGWAVWSLVLADLFFDMSLDREISRPMTKKERASARASRVRRLAALEDDADTGEIPTKETV